MLDRRPGSEEAPLLDVIEVHLRLSESELGRWRELCDAFGHGVQEETAGQVFHGPEMRYVVSASDAHGGVTALRMSLAHSIQRDPLVLGNVELRFEGDSALFLLRR